MRFPIMAAPESAEHETRVVFDAGDERLVLMANEAFAFAGDDFEKEVKEWVARWAGKYRIEALSLPVKGTQGDGGVDEVGEGRSIGTEVIDHDPERIQSRNATPINFPIRAPWGGS